VSLTDSIRPDTENHDDNEEDKHQQSKLPSRNITQPPSRVITRNNSKDIFDTNMDTVISIEDNLLLERNGGSVSLTDSTRDGETPITLMIKYEHIDMLREFLGESAVYSLDCYSGHGERNQSYKGMYNALSTIPPHVIK
jgi:hypothetical protein